MLTLDSQIVSSFLSCGIFLIGFMAFGVLSDWKEAVRLPSDAEGSFRAALDAVTAAARTGALRAPVPALRALRALLAAFVDVVDGTVPYAMAQRAMADASAELQAALAAGGATAAVGAAAAAAAALYARAARVEVIARASFPLAGYALLDILIAALIALTLTMTFATFSTGILYAGVFTYIFVYMGVLARTLDAPFAYPPHFNARRLHHACDTDADDRGSFAVSFETLTRDFARDLAARLVEAGDAGAALQTCQLTPEAAAAQGAGAHHAAA
jgi:hypothetical protein